jgi:ABC-type multidrug transport system fused ATPase/permease subunit
MRFYTPLVTFTLFVVLQRSTGQELNASTAYTTLSLITLLDWPTNTLLRAIPMLNSALGCFDRIQAFLESDFRKCYVFPRENPSISSQDQDYTSSGGNIELNMLNLKSQRHSDPTMIEVQNASFAWSPNSRPTINNVSFCVLRQHFVFIIGPVGCGTSTLLKGLVSETPSATGFIHSDASEIAFVDQTPWAQNITIRQNILGQSSFDAPWFGEVTRACALDYDIAGLPNGDGTCA